MNALPNKTVSLIGIATSTRGNVCKKYPDGKSSHFFKGKVETRHCHSLNDLKNILKAMKSNQCLVMGVPKNRLGNGDVTHIGPMNDLKPYEICRTKKNFIPGSFILIDYDYNEQFKCRQASDVHEWMCKILPDVFVGTGYLAVKSSSSRVMKDGQPLKGTSWHLYYIVDAPKQSKWLADNFMLAAEKQGYTYFKTASDGKQLKRTIIDLQPLKIGGCGISYEADPIVKPPYSLVKNRIRIVDGCDARTSVLKPISKGIGIVRKKIICDKLDGFWQKPRALHYSDAYRKLSPADRDVLDDICMQFHGGNHGTEGNPIKCPYSDFIAHPTRVKKALDVLQKSGFIRYTSNKKTRAPNHYFLNFDMLFMSSPKGWKPWN